jgi:hypothetical protein
MLTTLVSVTAPAVGDAERNPVIELMNGIVWFIWSWMVTVPPVPDASPE